MRRAWIAIVLLTPALVGCLGAEDEPTNTTPGTGNDTIPSEAVTWAEKALPHSDEHDHSDRSQHQNLSTENFELLGFDPLYTDYHGETGGDYFCGGAVTEGERDIAVTNGFSNDVAFVATDVSDPDDPEKVGELVLPYSHTYDVDVTPDGQYVAVAISGTDTSRDDGQGPVDELGPADGMIHARYENSCGDTYEMQFPAETPYKSGVVLVDISEPSSPDIVDYESQPVLGPHSIFATKIDDTYHILASTTNLQHQASYFTFFGIEDTPAGAQLVQQGEYTAQQPETSYSGTQPPLTNGHVDGWIQKHPVTDQKIAYLANWNGGLHVVEFTDTGVQNLAVWNNYDASAGSGMTGQIHGALPIEGTWNDTHYTFIGQEVTTRPTERPTGEVLMMDTTDPANPTPVARWTLPDDVEFDDSLQFSTHYFQLVDQTLFVSMYHGGVWAVDASPENAPNLPTEGVFVHNETSPQPPDESRLYATWTPTTLDVLALPSGDLVTFDGTSGLYTIRFDPGLDVPSPDPWDEDPILDDDLNQSGDGLIVG